MSDIISKDMTIAEVLDKLPKSMEMLQAYGLHCIGCHVNAFETLEQGFEAHGLPKEELENLIRDLNSISRNDDLNLAEDAAQKIRGIMKNNTGGIRISVSEQMQYSMEFAERAGENEIVIVSRGIELYLSRDDSERLKNTTIHFVKTEQGEGFIFQKNA